MIPFSHVTASAAVEDKLEGDMDGSILRYTTPLCQTRSKISKAQYDLAG